MLAGRSSLARSPMPCAAKLALCAPSPFGSPESSLRGPRSSTRPWPRAGALLCARPVFSHAQLIPTSSSALPSAPARPSLLVLAVGPVYSSQSLRCRVPGRVCVVVFFRGNAHFVVVLRSLLGPAWVLVVGRARPCFLCLTVVVRSPCLDVGPYVMSPTCVRADKRIPRRCREASPWSMPQVLGERPEQESSPFMRSSS
ncbi:uncharacterized protein LOC100384221 [Zea mays]|jgi:hypothetical protein|uniref:Uncharacterized protein n=1 Tax=Zea mays TaxID=4577 RepID=C0PMK4_MAIZE|nr:uncharacterized protein LOC100384221 [Zea mays]ACN36420.1 unknown [Zea mays]|eukprot:NP_001170264.1 uncharacterized protein LOC100384221 [Zea mays]